MDLRTPGDVGAAIRHLRKAHGLSQAALAERVGVSRQWVIDLEGGKRRVELGLVLEVLASLGVVLKTDAELTIAATEHVRALADADIPDPAEAFNRRPLRHVQKS